MLGSHKVEVVAYTLNNDVTIYKIVEKHYFLGIRVYTGELPKTIMDLEQAKLEAKEHSDRLLESYGKNVISKKIIHVVKP